jgi:hypothetical protein
MAEFVNRFVTGLVAAAVLVVVLSLLDLPNNPARKLLDLVLGSE